MCAALLGVYVFTGEDCNSAFKGKGKKRAIQLVQSNTDYLRVFAKLGDSWSATRSEYRELEKFVCALYGLPRFSKVNKARAFKLKAMCGNKKTISRKHRVDLYRLPPCKNSLKPHVDRVIFQLKRLKLSNVKKPDIPNPAPDHGWIVSESGHLEPKWTDGDILPQQMVDILAAQNNDADSESDSSDDDREDSSDEEGDESSGPDSDWSDVGSD